MKVFAVNSSPRPKGQSRTLLMLESLLKGMREAGADVEMVNLREKEVRFCTGCYTCWTRTPGKCVQRDDMTKELLPKFLDADMVIFASPLYQYTVTASMKAFIERTLPAFLPYLEQSQGAFYHPLRGKHPAVVILSVAGFPGMEVFNQLSGWANYLFGKNGRQPGVKLAAEIYRTSSQMMTFTTGKLGDILNATEQAGRELVQEGRVKPETMALVQQPLDENATVLEMANLSWHSLVDAGLTPAQFDKQGRAPRPDSLKTLMTMLKIGFNPDKAAGKKGVLQFNLTGEVAGSCYFKVADGRIEAFEGQADKPDLKVDAAFEVWADVIAGKLDGAQAFFDGKYLAEGDIGLMNLFGK
jgi:multimeric flavodoxin WrbA/putative sterol carrier protein